MIWATTQHSADISTLVDILNHGRPLSDEDFELAKKTVTEIILGGLQVQSTEKDCRPGD